MPTVTHQRRLPNASHQTIGEQCDYMAQLGVTKPVNSPTVVHVKKKTGDLKFYNFRANNAQHQRIIHTGLIQTMLGNFK